MSERGSGVFLQLFQGVVNAFDTPARQAFVTEMVGVQHIQGIAPALLALEVPFGTFAAGLVIGCLLLVFGLRSSRPDLSKP